MQNAEICKENGGIYLETVEMDNSTNLSAIITRLESLFSSFNERFYQGALQKPVITANSRGRRRCIGWCTGWKAWDDARRTDPAFSDSGYYEINICAEYLDRPFEEICETLLHEMVHLYNLQTGVQDTSRSGLYHNMRFKRAAEKHGLLVSKDGTYGFCFTELNAEAKAFIDSLGGSGFKLCRKGRSTIQKGAGRNTANAHPKPQKFVLEYRCPTCGLTIHTPNEARLLCVKCGVELMDYNAALRKILNVKAIMTDS